MSSLQTYLSDNARSLIALIPTARDGGVEAIHDARVATRRIRAALDIITRHRPEPHLDEAAAMTRRLARALGRARDVDVSLELLSDLERRAPAAASAAAFCRGRLLRERTAARRRLVRKIDSMPIDTLPTLLAVHLPRLTNVLAERAQERAGRVIDAVHHASGVYFPKRAHAARVGIKKLRYLLEFGAASDEEAVRVLRKCQQTLGEVQDRKVLYDTVAALREDSSADLEPLLAQVEAESVVLYDRFLERRDELLAACARIAAPSRVTVLRPRAVTGTLVMLGAVAAGSAWHKRRASGD